MNAQILVCDQIQFDADVKAHKLGYVVNKLVVPCFPYICRISVLVKLSDIPADSQQDCYVKVYNNDGKRIGLLNRVLRNHRPKEQVSGVDFNCDLSFLALKSENIIVCLEIGTSQVATYPLYVEQAV